MTIENDETLQMYVEESQEHLADIESDLLAIEQGGADIDEELVNKVFRAAHSIKGGAGFMGLTNIKELAHKMENVLGMIRSREMVPNPEIVNILLLASDALRDLIGNAVESNDIDVSEHIEALIAVAEGALPDEGKEAIKKTVDIYFPDGTVAFTVAEYDILQARQGGKFVYLAEFDLIHDVHEKGKTPLDVLRELEKTGLLLESRIAIEGVGTLEDGEPTNRLPFLVLYATLLDPTVVNTLFEIDEQRIFKLGEDLTTRPIGLEPGTESGAAQEAPGPSGPVSEEPVAPKPVDAPTQALPSESRAPERPEPEDGSAESRATQPKAATQNKPTPKQVRPKAKSKTKEAATKGPEAETSLRVHVSLLDTLMTLAGELVLGRNQLLQAIEARDMRTIQLGGQRLDLITSELQEAIMLTRMQPIGNVFNKFQRVVRDLARSLQKEIELVIEGSEVELDKTIIEAISDPLTHLVRNSADHGIEIPDERIKAGKGAAGTIQLKAFHEAGQVNIEITDDGRGINGDKLAASAVSKGLITEEQARMMSDREKVNLIFLPGFSTAEKVTDVSGRGVGMDVVKTNLDKLGGVVDIESEPGKGTKVRIKLPLTLAIIPSQIITVGNDRYAIPQVNMDELLRIPASQIRDRIEKVGDAEVVRLRGHLLPLLKLSEVLGVAPTYVDPEDGTQKTDRRRNIADRRCVKNPVEARDDRAGEGAEPAQETVSGERADRRSLTERRFHAESAVNIVVVSAGPLKYGLVVDRLHDSEEIVVKPLGRHLKRCKGYAGATIMGDGRVALILDVGNLVQMAGLVSVEGTERAEEMARKAAEAVKARKDMQSLLIFRSAEDEQFAVTLSQVERIEKVKAADIEKLGERRVMRYRGGSLPLFTIDQVAQVKPLADQEDLLVIVFIVGGREVGLLAIGPVDATEVSAEVDDTTLKQPGIMGSAIVGDHTTQFVDVYAMVETLHPEWFEQQDVCDKESGEAPTLLIVEDSNFFRNQVKGFMEEAGYHVIEAEDGVVAWNILDEQGEEISLVVTDIEMPNMDGFVLTKKIKGDERFAGMPVIALTTLAGEGDVARGKEVGIDDYQIKLDREKLMESVRNHLVELTGR
ncbi:MAG: chemotaxis protein CheW [Deltaproteobacteria bacterium]|nr:chemotaxis protein CheW [Deltaproteobacteria bacterium]